MKLRSLDSSSCSAIGPSQSRLSPLHGAGRALEAEYFCTLCPPHLSHLSSGLGQLGGWPRDMTPPPIPSWRGYSTKPARTKRAWRTWKLHQWQTFRSKMLRCVPFTEKYAHYPAKRNSKSQHILLPLL